MTFIDSHSHLNSEEFKESWQTAVAAAKNNNVSVVINCGGDLSDSEWGTHQANQEPIVYATVGIHPEALTGSAPNMTEATNNLRRLISNSSKVVAIGEIGLDYTLDPDQSPKQAQIDLITPQIALAAELDLPIVLHVRDHKDSTNCFNDMIALLKQFKTSNDRFQALDSRFKSNKKTKPTPYNLEPRTSHLSGVFHCWTGTPDQVKQALDLDFFISFSGILTYKSAGHILDAAAIVPDDRILIETDAPFLTPEPARSKEHPSVNESKYVILTAEKLAQVRNTTLEHIADITTENAKKLFKLK